MGSLQAHEARMNRSLEKFEDKAFQVKEESSIQQDKFGERGYGREANCWSREEQANYVEENEEESMLFMVHSSANDVSNEVWFLDSGCSKHMSGVRSMFKELDESHKLQVRLGDNKPIQVEGKEKKSGHTIVNVRMTENKMFPLEVSSVQGQALVVGKENDSTLWHLRYGHLNINGLKLLSQKGMVLGLQNFILSTLYVRHVFMESKVESHFLSEKHGGLLIVLN
ncbi:uncharacterized protein LOC119985569 [Tripterygium wilfordii]|uniref:uncharacterized protein LOC119985569 n=1 Tax=Tripterygium wilfordii TaxID=458696 RepID=UPI0018F809ED|nr:uncharacterized protein LOC119985569 [Tripterygium wilfordii]